MNKYVFTGVVIFLLLGAFVFKWGGSTVDESNAVEDCPVYNVRCPAIRKMRTDEPSVALVGDKISDYCPTGAIGCYSSDMNTIFLIEDDWKVLAHERCHWLCGREHIRPQGRDVKDIYKIDAN